MPSSYPIVRELPTKVAETFYVVQDPALFNTSYSDALLVRVEDRADCWCGVAVCNNPSQQLLSGHSACYRACCYSIVISQACLHVGSPQDCLADLLLLLTKWVLS